MFRCSTTRLAVFWFPCSLSGFHCSLPVTQVGVAPQSQAQATSIIHIKWQSCTVRIRSGLWASVFLSVGWERSSSTLATEFWTMPTPVQVSDLNNIKGGNFTVPRPKGVATPNCNGTACGVWSWTSTEFTWTKPQWVVNIIVHPPADFTRIESGSTACRLLLSLHLLLLGLSLW